MEFEDLLKIMVQKGGSDLFITAGVPPSMKIHGKVVPVTKTALTPDMTRDIVFGVMTEKQRKEFVDTKECNFAISARGIGRFRVSAFYQRNLVGMVIRRIEVNIPNVDDLRLPPVIKELAMVKRGLVIFVGATGTGKSTSLAAMIGYRNKNSRGHIITIEDPIEFIHQHQGCIVTQREVGLDTETFEIALKNTLRQAPDVILIGERWNLTLGARQSHLETDTYTYFAAFPPFPASFSRTDRTDRLEMYQAGIQFNPVPQLALFLNGEKSARFPNADEVASGNPEPLIPQTDKVLTAGMRWQQAAQQSTLTTWYGKFDDEILYLDNGSGFCCNTNLEDQTRRQGVSLNTRFELDSDLWLTLNGSWQEATFAEGDLRGNDLPQIPEYSAFGQFDWQALNWLRATLAHRYVGERRLQGDLDNNASMQESYTWTDLVLAAKHGPWSSRIGVYNLEDNVVSDTGFDLGVGGYNGYPLPDRHVMAEIGVQW